LGLLHAPLFGSRAHRRHRRALREQQVRCSFDVVVSFLQGANRVCPLEAHAQQRVEAVLVYGTASLPRVFGHFSFVRQPE